LLNKKLDQILAKIFPAYGAMKAGHVEPALQKAADAAISELRGIAASSMLFADVPGDAIPSSSDNMNIKVYNSDDPLQRMDEALKQIAQMRESMANEDAQRYQRMLSTNQQTDARVSANQQSAAQLGTKAIAAISSQAQQALHAHAGLSADMTLMLLN
jgi:hypothetical protein